MRFEPSDSLRSVIQRTILRGSAYMIGIKVAGFLINAGKALLIAKHIEPADIGQTGIAILAYSFVEIMSQTGFQTALIQRPIVTARHFDLAWTVGAARGLALCLLLFSCSGAIAGFFAMPGTADYVRMISVSFLLAGLSNTCTISWQRNYEYRKIAIFETVSILADFIVVLLGCVWLSSPYFIVLGLVSANASKLVLSHAMTALPVRPCMDWKVLLELWRFGRWISLGGIIVYLGLNVDAYYVGKVFGAAILGMYLVVFKIGSIPSIEVTRAVSATLLPLYSRYQSDRARFRELVRRTNWHVAVLITPVCALIAYFGRAILEFLNPEYLAVHVALLVLVAFGLARSIANCLSPVMLALGKPKWLFTISTAQLVLIAGCLALLPSRLGVGGVAICVAGAAWFVVGCLSLVVARELQISSWALIGSFALASVCSGVGIVAAYLISGIPCPNKVASCVLEGTAFILCYLITTILVWRTAHRRGYAEMVERVQDPERDAGPLL